MKIRNGFVSNSSSSSFIAIGITEVTKKDMKKILNANNIKFNDDDKEKDLENLLYELTEEKEYTLDTEYNRQIYFSLGSFDETDEELAIGNSDKITKIFNEFEKDFPGFDPILFAGTCYC